MTSPIIKVAPCTFEAAKYAVMNWHYSKKMPSGKLTKFGVWEDSKFIGTVIFGRGASPKLYDRYNLSQYEACELVRVALTTHKSPVSQIVGQVLKEFKRYNPGMRLIVSFADPRQGHIGTIYQAMNWIYEGETPKKYHWIVKGEEVHSRTFGEKYKTVEKLLQFDPTARKIHLPGKHRYLYPLDKKMRRDIAKVSKEYPHAVEGLEASRSDSIGEVQVQSLPTAREAS